ncbi:MAG: LamG-like jellyroll fold domain-containing protein, partial [Planctomycetota bacterium]
LTSTSSHATNGTEWVHVAGTWKQNASRLYVNGVEEASDLTVSGTLSVADAQSVGIGGIYQSGSYSDIWIGRIGYVFIYNRALARREVEWLYREPFAMFEYPSRSAFVVAAGASVPLAGSVDSTSTASARLESIGPSPRIEQRWRLDALFNGMSANAFKLGTTLSLGWFWVRVGGCSALYRGPGTEQIDFESILAIAEKDALEISPPNYLPHDDLSTYFYVVRRFNHCGYQELTLAAAAKVSLDAQGELAKPQPNKAFALSAEQTDSNKIRLTWFYCPLEQESQPARFNIYCDNGAGQIDYENPVGTVSYQGRKFYTYVSDTLQTGRYLFAVRAEDLAGSENVFLDCLAIEISSAAPDAITILEAETV